MYNSVEFIKSKKDAQYIYKKFQLTHNDNKANIFVYCIPLLALSFFLYKGLNNNFSYLNDDKGEEVLLNCPEGYTLKNIVFHDKSGFYVNDSKGERKKYQKDFNNILDTYSDIIVLTSQLPIRETITIDMTLEEVYKRDAFKVLKFLLPFSDHRLFHLYTKEQKLLKVMGDVYLSGGGFFIHPINKKLKSIESLIILREDMMKKGFNNINTCL